MKYMKCRHLSFHLSYKVVNTRTRRRIEVAVRATSVEHSLETVTPSSSFLKEKLKQGYSFKKTRIGNSSWIQYKGVTISLSSSSPFFSCWFYILHVNVTLYIEKKWSEQDISVGNSMICSDIWHKYHEWYFKIVISNFTSR